MNLYRLWLLFVVLPFTGCAGVKFNDPVTRQVGRTELSDEMQHQQHTGFQIIAHTRTIMIHQRIGGDVVRQ